MIRAAIALLLVACSNPAPSPTVSSPPVGTEQCRRWAGAMKQHCALETEVGMELCMRLSRVAEAASCTEQVKRSYACGAQRYTACTNNDACCRELPDTCEDVDTALDHCVRGYCVAHLGNPDCTKTFPDLATGSGE
jgi:hypothetical protein